MADATVKIQDGRAIIDIAYTSAEQTRAGTPAVETIDVPDPGDDDAAVEALVKGRVSEYLATKAAPVPASRVVPVDTSRVAAAEVDATPIGR